MGWGGAPIAAASSRGVLRQNSEGERCNRSKPMCIIRAQGKVGRSLFNSFHTSKRRHSSQAGAQRRRELEPSFLTARPMPKAGFHVAAALRFALQGMTAEKEIFISSCPIP